jgi:signal peptidase I
MNYDDRAITSEIGAQDRGTVAGRTADGRADNFVPSPELTQPPDSAPPVVSPTVRGSRAVREIVETLLLALVIFVGVRLVVLNFRVDGSSMIPNLHDREMLLVNRNVYFHFDANRLRNLLPGEDRDGEDVTYLFHPPERGDIVIFEPPVDDPEKPYIKRVIGLPGETVQVRGGNVYIDGVELNEPYIEDDITDCGGSATCPEETVGEGEVYVMGDNRQNSSDSRGFGPVDVDSIIGKAWITYWPMDEIGLVPHYDYPEIADSNQ